jgi:AraC family transcriptional regulator, regulatory protein of adaptative response / methylated-DNA-[protein]-cysteine methyltransferase
MENIIPDNNLLYNALLNKDSSFEGLFYVAVKTTGIFCRLSCNARKPKKENVEFFPSTRDAILSGYRPCKVCNPLENSISPEWLNILIKDIEEGRILKIKDYELRKRGFDPARVRRWFKKIHGMTFQTYLRTRRIGEAFTRINEGEKVIDAALESGYNSLSGFTEIFKKTIGASPKNSNSRKIITVTKLSTPLGLLIAGTSEKGICLLEFIDRRMFDTQIKRLTKLMNAEFLPGNNKYLSELAIQLEEYFQGKRKEFTIPIDYPGSTFQRKVWDALLTIPYGETRSYKQQSEIIGIPGAIRAVGKANGDNRIAIIIPCHRVIGSTGELVGYGGGLWRKQYLLKLEKDNK